MSESLVVKRDPIETLAPKERQALDDYRRRNQAPMSPATAANFFQLYVEGFTLEQMLEGNRAWGLGAIADACVRYDWPAKREAYIDDVHLQAVSRLQKLKAESINYLANLLAVEHTRFRQEMIRYLQNPTGENLPEGRLKSAKDYKALCEAIETVSKIGQPANPAASPQGITVNAAPGSQVAVVASQPGDNGADILRKLADESRGSSKKPQG